MAAAVREVEEHEGRGQQEKGADDDDQDMGLGAFFRRTQAAPPYILPAFGQQEQQRQQLPVVELRQDSRSALGGRVWRAALFLLRWLAAEPEASSEHLRGRGRGGGGALSVLANKAVLDMGAGIGVLGLACARARPPPRVVCLTDQACLLPLLQENAARVRAVLATDTHVCVHRLDWLEEGGGADAAAVVEAAGPGGYDYILVADCVYYEHLSGPLVKTLAAVAGEGTRVVVCNDDGRTAAEGVETLTGERWDAPFFRLLAEEFEWDGDRVYPVGAAFGLEGGAYRVVVCRKRRGGGGGDASAVAR